MEKKFEVIDLQTKVVVAYCKTKKSARMVAERKNLQYGAHRYAVKIENGVVY